MKPRKYQSEFVNNINIELARHRRVIACAATGSGKSFVFEIIAKKALAAGRTVLIISESTKIYDQIADKNSGFEIARGKKHVIVSEGKLYTAMAQTLARRPLIIHQFQKLIQDYIIIVDEAHIGTPTKLLKKLIFEGDNNPYLIGFTATPDARIAKHLPKLYNGFTETIGIDELIQQGYLCSYKHFARTRSDLSGLEISGGEYSEKSHNKVFDKAVVYDGLIEDLRKAKFNKAMVFVASIELAEKMNEALVQEGFKSISYHSKKENGEYELAKFTKLNEANVCVSVASLTKGFDFPPVDAIFLVRKTKSLPLYLQMLGRGSRVVIKDGEVIKNHFNVFDYADNWKEHGLYFEVREWSEMWNVTKKKSKKKGVASTKMCEFCFCIISAMTRICPECGEELKLSKEELAQGEFIEITRSYSDLVGRKLSELTPKELTIYVNFTNKKALGARVARTQGIDFLKEYQKIMKYKKNWVNYQAQMALGFNDIIIR